MKKFLSFMTALLLAVVFTATGVHAANPSAAGGVSNVKVVDASGKEVAATVTPVAQNSVAVAKNLKGVVLAVEFNAPEGAAYTVTLTSADLGDGQYTYTHFKSDTDATVVDQGTTTAKGGTVTITLHGASPVVFQKAGTTAAAGGKGTAVPNTVDAE
jgi:hypothetical protein